MDGLTQCFVPAWADGLFLSHSSLRRIILMCGSIRHSLLGMTGNGGLSCCGITEGVTDQVLLRVI